MKIVGIKVKEVNKYSVGSIPVNMNRGWVRVRTLVRKVWVIE